MEGAIASRVGGTGHCGKMRQSSVSYEQAHQCVPTTVSPRASSLSKDAFCSASAARSASAAAAGAAIRKRMRARSIGNCACRRGSASSACCLAERLGSSATCAALSARSSTPAVYGRPVAGLTHLSTSTCTTSRASVSALLRRSRSLTCSSPLSRIWGARGQHSREPQTLQCPRTTAAHQHADLLLVRGAEHLLQLLFVGEHALHARAARQAAWMCTCANLGGEQKRTPRALDTFE